MRTSLDCIPCFIRQALNAARLASEDGSVHERILQEALRWAIDINMDQPTPVMAQRIHRLLRKIVGSDDPYRDVKDHQNSMAMALLPEMRSKIEAATDPLSMALQLAIAGNVIDLGVNGNVTEGDVRESINQALTQPLVGEQIGFRNAVTNAQSILYLADNAGEIAFDRLLVEQLTPARVTVAVRGAPVINDVTMIDARTVGLNEIVEVIDNGSDAPGTLLEDCCQEFKQRFNEVDLIIAKGQGNYETLSDEPYNIFFLLKAKCSVIAAHVGVPIGTHVLAHSNNKNKSLGVALRPA
ncbi:ARMT1-like domain-containing protein [bacterium]|nr:ARMT1-like domain-containing protein [bacterium]